MEESQKASIVLAFIQNQNVAGELCLPNCMYRPMVVDESRKTPYLRSVIGRFAYDETTDLARTEN